MVACTGHDRGAMLASTLPTFPHAKPKKKQKKKKKKKMMKKKEIACDM